MHKSNQPIFEEVQYFRQFKVFFYPLLALLIGLCYLSYFVIQDVFIKPENINPTDALISTCAMMLGILLIAHLCFLTRLITVVTPKGLFVRFVPFHFRWKAIDLKNVKSVEAREYRPIREYGGWGIRIGLKKKAYNVYGCKGVEILYRNGYKLLIGSQRYMELAEAVRSMVKK